MNQIIKEKLDELIELSEKQNEPHAASMLCHITRSMLSNTHILLHAQIDSFVRSTLRPMCEQRIADIEAAQN